MTALREPTRNCGCAIYQSELKKVNGGGGGQKKVSGEADDL